MKKFCLILLFIFFFFKTNAQSPSWIWAQLSNNDLFNAGGGEGYEGVTDVGKNVIYTGDFAGPTYFGSTELNAFTNAAFFVKYDSSGNLLWAKQSTAVSLNGQASSLGCAADSKGNTYFTGLFYDTVAFGSAQVTSTDNGSIFTVKYDANGNVIWAKQAMPLSGIPNPIYSNNITTDKDGNVYITGIFEGTVSFDGIQLNGGQLNFFIVKYNANGNVVWAITPQYLSYELYYTYISGPTSLVTDKHKNLYVTGTFLDTLTVGSYTLISANSTYPDIFIIKYDSMGKVVWAQQSSDVNNYQDEILSVPITADKEGNVYISGPYFNSINFGSVKISSAPGQGDNVFLMKMDSAGKIVWWKSSQTAAGTIWNSYSLSADTLSDIYLSCGNDVNYNTTTDSIKFDSHKMAVVNTSSDGNSSIWKFDTSGNVLCSSIIPGAGDDWNFVTTDPTGKYVYFGGDLYTSLFFANDSLISPSTENLFVARWQPCICDLSVTIVPPSPSICAGQSVTLTSLGGTNYTWSPSTGLTATTGDTVVASPTIQTTYTVTGTDSLGCAATGSSIVYVSPTPSKPIIMRHDSILTSSATQGNQWVRNDSTLQGATNQNYVAAIAGWYMVIAENPANGCSATSDSMYFSPTGVNQLTVESGQLTVYPNPTGGEVFININSSVAEVKDWNLQVTDVLGRIVYTKQSLTYNNAIDLSNLPGGVYFISVVNKMGRVVVPVVVSR